LSFEDDGIAEITATLRFDRAILLFWYYIGYQTVSNDIRKNKIAENKNIKLLRFWELDINNNLDSVIEILKKELF
jgi:hypothetical protein